MPGIHPGHPDEPETQHAYDGIQGAEEGVAEALQEVGQNAVESRHEMEGQNTAHPNHGKIRRLRIPGQDQIQLEPAGQVHGKADHKACQR